MTGPAQSRNVRERVPFAAVNRPGSPGYAADLQRHHLLPRQAIDLPGLRRLFEALGCQRIGFDDFRRNGMLLPGRESAVLRLGLPLHLGPHRDYNGMVIERLGMIEAAWSMDRARHCHVACEAALMRIALLQAALRRRILDRSRPLTFNRADRFGRDRDFTLLDRLAEELWAGTAP